MPDIRYEVTDNEIIRYTPIFNNSTFKAEVILTKDVLMEALDKWRPTAKDIVNDVMEM